MVVFKEKLLIDHHKLTLSYSGASLLQSKAFGLLLKTEALSSDADST